MRPVPRRAPAAALPATLLLALFVPGVAAAQECPTVLYPSSFDPGASLILNADDVPTSAFCGGGAANLLEVYAGATLLGKQRTSANGTVVELGAYQEGDELIVTLYVPESGQTYSTGPAWRNPDNQFHGSVAEIEPGVFLVGFTDRQNGGIDAYDNQNPYLYTDVSVTIAVDAHLERLPDTDGDGVPNESDVCLYDPDYVDVDEDLVPDCLQVDSDGDTIVDSADQCPGQDDRPDVNQSGVPDCVEVVTDADLDGVPNEADLCPGYDDTENADGSAYPDCLERAYDVVFTDSEPRVYCDGYPVGGPLTYTVSLPAQAPFGPEVAPASVQVTSGTFDHTWTVTSSAWAYTFADAARVASWIADVDYSSGYIETFIEAYGASATQLADHLGEALPVTGGTYWWYLEDWVTGGLCYVDGAADTVRLVNRLDTDNDGVPNPYDACDGDDLAGDSDADGTCDDLDLCWGDDGLGDTDGDGTCDDLDQCATDLEKVAPGDCGCGTPDVDGDTDGVVDCLEEALILDGRRSLLYFDTRRPTQSYAQFTGTLALGGGLLAPDLRDGTAGIATAEVLVGTASPITVFDGPLAFVANATGNAVDNAEQWRYRASAVEQASIHFKNSQKYNSERDLALPDVRDAGDWGQLRSRYVHTDEVRLRFRWDSDTELPLTVAIDGVAVLTVTADPTGACVDGGVTTCLDGYAIVSSYDLYEIHSGGCERIVDVDYIGDRLGDGNVIAWYADGDAADGLTGLLHSHEAIDDGSESSVWRDAGGRFDVIVPLNGRGVSAGSTDRSATLSLQLGGVSTAAVVEGSVTFGDYERSANRTATTWRSREVDEDESCLLDQDEWSCEDED